MKKTIYFYFGEDEQFAVEQANSYLEGIKRPEMNMEGANQIAGWARIINQIK